MRKFVINVNGNKYEVEVEEVGGVSSQPAYTAAPAAPVAPAAQAAPAAPATQKPDAAPVQAPVAAGAAGAVKITAPMPGTILDVKVKVGDTVKRGDILVILEAMKMENEIVAPQDGTIASVNISKGSSVNSGELIISMNSQAWVPYNNEKGGKKPWE